MLVQRCTLEHHRLVVLVSVSKPELRNGAFASAFETHEYRALVDTGAQRTVVSRSVIAKHKLLRTGHMEFKGIHDPRTHSRYLAAIGLWSRRIDSSTSGLAYDQTEQSLFALQNPIEIVDMDENKNFEVILGFDILKNFSFSFDSQSQSFDLVVLP